MMSPATPDGFQPLQLKGEIMDLEFNIDTDHRLAFLQWLTGATAVISRLINRLVPSTPINHPKIGKGGETAQHKVV